MFDKLKKAFSSAAKGIGQKEITEKVLDDSLFDLQMSLLESDVAQEAVDSLSAKLKKELLGLRLEKGEDAGKIIHSSSRMQWPKSLQAQVNSAWQRKSGQSGMPRQGRLS
jgi:fused signal recognition particle receptor